MQTLFSGHDPEGQILMASEKIWNHKILIDPGEASNQCVDLRKMSPGRFRRISSTIRRGMRTA